MRSFSTSWTSVLAKLGFRRKFNCARRANCQKRLRFEQCEDRRLLAVITVSSDQDNTIVDGVITLREIVNFANADDDPDTIQFDPAVFNTPKTILLT